MGLGVWKLRLILSFFLLMSGLREGHSFTQVELFKMSKLGDTRVA